jgi:hypothetical protein
MGHLQVDGTLELAQFWPTGSSDGDTARVVVKRITFNGQVTHALDRAQVRGRTQKAVLDEHRAITVRLQGIDAPELHYMPSIPKAKAKKQDANFRQHYGRAAARARGTIVLVDGALLTSLMMDHGVAVSHKALRIPKVDNDYFEDV